MPENQNITGIIIAGGKSSRMGSDKALVDFNGKKLIEYSIDLMKKVADEIIISANENKYSEYGFPVIPDNFPGSGPLSGLEAALKHSINNENIIIPCDTPFVTKDLYNLILSYQDGYDAVVPVSENDKPEPLIAFYSKDILPALTRQIKKGDYKMQNLLNIINTRYIRIDNSHILRNINTINDLK